MSKLLEVRGLSVDFVLPNGSKRVLDDVSFDLKRGEVLGLVGESGSGKSMTANAISCLLPKKAQVLGGEVIFFGDETPADFLKLSEREMRNKYRAKRVSLIFQDAKGSFSPPRSVGRHIEEMVRLHKGVSKKKAKGIAKEIFGSMFGDSKEGERNFDKITQSLSGGQAQRASIALAALVTKPDVLIADEATTALDVTVQAKVLDELMQVVRENNISLIFITHDFGLVAEYADRVVVLDKGKVVETGVTEDVFYRPQSEFVKNVLRDLPRIDKRLRQKEHTSLQNNVINVQNLSVAFPYTTPKGLFGNVSEKEVAVNNISLEIKEGEIFGVVGESGSGKTTFMRSVLRVLPDIAQLEGSVDVLDKDVYALEENQLRALRKMVGGVPQGTKQSLTPRKRIDFLISEALDIHNLYESDNADKKEEERRERVAQLMEAVELPVDRMRDYVARLSGGEAQRVAIASALATNPKVLFLDEPTASLDASRKHTILNLLLKLQEERGLTYVLISHELPTIASICDRVAVMWKGRIVELGGARQVLENSLHPYTQILRTSFSVPDPKEARRNLRLRKEKNLVMPSFSAQELESIGQSELVESSQKGHYVDDVTQQLFFNKMK